MLLVALICRAGVSSIRVDLEVFALGIQSRRCTCGAAGLYFTSPQFHERMATIADQFQQMQADLTREKAAMNRTWAKREKQIETIVFSTAKFTGELQALYGSSWPALPQFALPQE